MHAGRHTTYIIPYNIVPQYAAATSYFFLHPARHSRPRVPPLSLITEGDNIMVKFGLRLDQNKSNEYPSDAYVDYDKLKEIIHVLAKKKLAGWVYNGGF